MPMFLRVPLPGPFTYTKRLRGPRPPQLAKKYARMQAQNASLRQSLATTTALPMGWWWTLAVIALLTFVSPYTAIFGFFLAFALWARSPWRVARRDRRVDPPTEPIDLRESPARYSNRR